MKKKIDEENFDEAEAQAYRCWTPTVVPSEIVSLFQDSKLQTLNAQSPVFFHLLAALKTFTEQSDINTLPLTSTLPDMKASTTDYIHLQKLYKVRAEEEKAQFKSYIPVLVDDGLVDLFVKNSHALKLMRGKRWGELDQDTNALCKSIYSLNLYVDLLIRPLASAVEIASKPLAYHLALSALSSLLVNPNATVTTGALTATAESLLPPGTEMPEDFENAAGEV